METRIDSFFGLVEALGVVRGDLISVVGAGGKTTVVYALATDLRRHGMTVVATTTTHMQTPRDSVTMPPLVFIGEETNWLDMVRARIDRYGSATVVGTELRQDKLRGLEPAQVVLLRWLADCVIVEADGARGRSLKAPARHEPVIPMETSLTVIVAGLDALGMPLDDAIVHRLDVVKALTSTPPGAPITEETIAATLAKGYLPRIPPGSRHVFFLNKADDARLRQAETIGRLLIESGASSVLFGEARHPHQCIYGIVPSEAGGERAKPRGPGG